MRRLAMVNPDKLIVEIEELRERLDFCTRFISECNSRVIPGDRDTLDVGVQKVQGYINALMQIREDYCGPAKMSESVGTLLARIRCIKAIADAALGDDESEKPADT